MGIRRSFGGKLDKQGWNEIREGINVGDKYIGGF